MLADAPVIAVLGCGSIGLRHLRNLRALGVTRLLAYDVRADRRQAAAEAGAVPVDTLERLWASRPQAVVIAAPTALHVPLALEAAQHGCHLFIEKPLGAQWDGVPELVEAVRAQRLISLVGCNLRFHPGLVAVKQLVEQGGIGRLLSVRIEAGQYLPDWHPQEDYRLGYSAQRALGGGVILDGIHELDYLRWLAGEIASVSCLAGKLSRLAIDTEDTAAMLLRCVSGAIGEVHVDYVQRAYSRSCQVIGEEGTIRWDFQHGTAVYRAADRRWDAVWTPEGWELNTMYVEELRHFLAALAGTAPSVNDVAEGARVLELALAAKRSAETGQFVECLPAVEAAR